MNEEFILRIILSLSLILCIANAIGYGIGYFTVRRSKVDGIYRLMKRTLLFQFAGLSFAVLLLGVVYYTVLFFQEYTTEALYLLAFILLLFLGGFGINLLLLAKIALGDDSN